MTARTCLWCEASFSPRQVNAAFCSNAHRNAYHQACRSYGHQQVLAGHVTISDLRAAASRPVHGS